MLLNFARAQGRGLVFRIREGGDSRDWTPAAAKMGPAKTIRNTAVAPLIRLAPSIRQQNEKYFS